MYRWYWFRRLQLGKTDLEEPRPAPVVSALPIARTAAPSPAAVGNGKAGGKYVEADAAA